MQLSMASRGRKTRLKPTVLDPRTISASTSSTPTDLSATSHVRVSTPIGSSQHESSNADRRRTSLVDEDIDGSEENGVGSDDVVATGSDAAASTVPESSDRVHGCDRPRSPRLAGDGKLIATVYGGKITGNGIPRFFMGQIKKRVEALWPHYSDVDPALKDKIWEYFLIRGSIARAKHIWEIDNQKKWCDLLTKEKGRALADNGVDDIALLLGMSCLDWIQDPTVWEQYVRYWC
ncbi:hypothetical protein LIER_30733 [Lithospermum erythrorhizon]|uniref:Uncharacterized protein n=1 Tax=Lithospermum erythrorhizon TaxID=34254 RepID=A0AAV3RNR0_LITER